jgi:hypothetical protein
MCAAYSAKANNTTQGPGNKCSTVGVQFHGGGTVMTTPKLYAVFWGPNVNSTVTSGIGSFYSSYLGFLVPNTTGWFSSDYSAGGVIGTGSYAGAYTITPFNQSTTLSQHDIESELTQQQGVGLPSFQTNNIYAVHFPPGITISTSSGTNCTNWCAYHSTLPTNPYSPPDVAYLVLPDMNDCAYPSGPYTTPQCRNDPDAFNDVTVNASHEIAEAITDPSVGWGAQWLAWYPEVGDPCHETTWPDSSTSNDLATLGSYVIQRIWSRTRNACISDSNDQSNYGTCCPGLYDKCGNGTCVSPAFRCP